MKHKRIRCNRALERAAEELRQAKAQAKALGFPSLEQSCEAVALQADDLRQWLATHGVE